MAVQWVLVVHVVVTMLVVVSLLCGHWPIFSGTFVEKIHYFLTFGAYDYFLFLGGGCGCSPPYRLGGRGYRWRRQ
ncbi:hypothetical protein BHE74_00016915 [Ensete ventricosum]|uniref:Uncharacterized protein n=1 Tax=Ensete ventricosum TaxID=4639 RepID=A0A426YMM7_ENSVE|nr:hypothetical protein B296_00049601 [Ensete ventricosum]RWW75088.1 hypothetical protein BHE74_00016915 [Ensete ventricosum]